MVDADAAMEHLLELGANPFRPVELVDLGMERSLLFTSQQRQSLELFGNAPAHVAIEGEDQGRRFWRGRLPLSQLDQVLTKQQIGNPVIRERHLALVALDQLDFTAMASIEPVDELVGIANRGREKQQTHVLGKEIERQLPHDATL